MTKDASVIKDWIEQIQNHDRGLTKWEEDFVESIADQFTERGSYQQPPGRDH